MGRTLALAAAVIFLVAGLALIVGALSLNRLLAANRDALLARVEASLGRPVRVDEIRVSWRAGFGVRLTQVEVGDDPDFGREPFVHAAAVTAHLDLLPLLSRRLEVGSVTLTDPVIRIVRAADGRRNYESLGRVRQTAATELLRRVSTEVQQSASAPPFDARIQSLAIQNGTVIASDHTQSPTRDVTIQRVDLTLRGLSRDSPVTFTLAAAAASDTRNVQVSGSVGPWNSLDGLPLEVRGALGPFPQLRAVIDGLDLRARVTSTAVEVAQLRGDALAGRFDLSGSCSLARGGPLRVAGTIRQVALDKLLAVTSEHTAVAIEGDAALQIDLGGQLADDVPRTLRGTVAAAVAHGRLRGFNIARELLERVARSPGLSDMLSGHVKPKYSRLFSATDTQFDQAKVTLRLADGRATTDDLILAAEDFAVRGAGWFDIDRQIDMSGSLVMSRRFSDDVIADVNEVKYIVDDNGQLALPFRLRGRLGDAKPKADERALTAMLSRALTRGAATDLLNQLFGGKRRATPSRGNDAGDALQRSLRDAFGH